MKYAQQFKLIFLTAPKSLSLFRRASVHWLIIYFLLALVLFGLFSSLLINNQENIRNLLLDYFFPQSWHELSFRLGNFLFESQAKVVIGNLIISGSLVFASVFLFPIKEKYSAQFELDAKLENGQIKEFPILYQALEEIKLFLLYLTAQSVILWVGYYPYSWTSWLSIFLSYLFLFFTFSLDFISPTLQRHRVKYSLILKLLTSHPILSLAFGVSFSLPTIFISQYIFTIESLTLIEISSMILLFNIMFFALAIPVGTTIASHLLKITKQITPYTKKTMLWGYSTATILLISGLYLHGQLVMSLHKKSQVLKANYAIDWSSFDYRASDLSKIFSAESTSHLSFDLVITNPTQFDIDIEESQIFIFNNSETISQIDLVGFNIPAGDKRKVRMRVNSISNFSLLTDYQRILQEWKIELHLQVWHDIPFVMKLYSDE